MNKRERNRSGWIKAVLPLFLLLAFAGHAFGAAAIEVGVIGPMDFPTGTSMWQGAQLAAEEINAEGGVAVNGKNYQIKLHQSNDNSLRSITDAIGSMERLATVDQVDYVVGGLYSEAVLAELEVAADNDIVYLCTSGVSKKLSQMVAKDYDRYKYWFRVTAINAEDVAKNIITSLGPVLETIRSELNVENPRVALLMDKASWTDPAVELLKDLLPKMDCELAGIWRTSIRADSMSSELSAIKSADAHLIVQANAGPAGNVLSRQWGELEIPAALAGANVEGQLHGHWEATDGYCDYMATIDWLGSAVKTEKTKPFLKDFNKKFGENPIYTGIAAYDAVYVLKEAIERAGSLKTDEVVSALEQTDYTGPVGRIVFNPPDHESPHATKWGPDYISQVGMQWRDGKRIAYWPGGQEIHPALIEAGFPQGWDKLEYKGVSEYALPPWVKEYWKDKN